MPGSHDASLYSARTARPAASGRLSGGQAAPQQPDEHVDWRNPSRSASMLALTSMTPERSAMHCSQAHPACKVRECCSQAHPACKVRKCCRAQFKALPAIEDVVCRVANEDTKEGLARPARSVGREGLTFRPAERNFTSSQPRHAVPLTEAEANHPFQQVMPLRGFIQVVSPPCCQNYICIHCRVPMSICIA